MIGVVEVTKRAKILSTKIYNGEEPKEAEIHAEQKHLLRKRKKHSKHPTKKESQPLRN